MTVKEKISQFFQTSPVLILYSISIIMLETDIVPIYTKWFGVFDTTHIAPLVFMIIYFLLFSFGMSVFYIQFLMRKNINDFGLRFPKNKKLAIALTASALLFLVPYITYCATKTSFHGYSLGSPSIPKFMFITGVLFPLFYFSEEFFFRGFLFISLWNRLGWHSFWITDIIFTVAHLGKPWLEVLLCIPASIIFNALTLVTRSILPAFVVHCSMGIILSTLVTFKLIGGH